LLRNETSFPREDKGKTNWWGAKINRESSAGGPPHLEAVKLAAIGHSSS